MASSFPIAQGSTLDFSFNWGPNTNGAAGPVGPGWLATGETITGQTVTVSPASGLTITTVSQASGAVTFWAAVTAAVGTFFTVTCSITTNNTPPRIDSRTMTIEVVAR